ncbi:MAG: hypothetical protein ABIJ92_00930 [Candidatus Aenigmatarchaeota archaeon]
MPIHAYACGEDECNFTSDYLIRNAADIPTVCPWCETVGSLARDYKSEGFAAHTSRRAGSGHIVDFKTRPDLDAPPLTGVLGFPLLDGSILSAPDGDYHVIEDSGDLRIRHVFASRNGQAEYVLKSVERK